MDRSVWSSLARTVARLAVGAALFACLLLPSVAQATFPGANGKIAFVSDRDGNEEIYVMNPDGTGQTRLTNDAASDIGPEWSPDGNKIAFVSNRAGQYQLYVMNATGGAPTRLSNRTIDVSYRSSTPSHWSSPSWSPDGTRLAFVHDIPGGPYATLFVVGADGSGETPVAGAIEGYDWSPDGKKLVFGNYGSGIETVNADGTGGDSIAYFPGENPCVCSSPAWSPDGEQVAFSARPDTFNWAELSVWTVNIAGGEPREFEQTRDECMSPQPSWSRNSQTITFLSSNYCSPGASIAAIDRDETNLRWLGGGGGPWGFPYDFNEVWSPRGDKLVFEHKLSYEEPNREVRTVNADGTGHANLTNAASDREPDWQPLRALSPYPRPGGGTPLFTYLVPAFERCTAPNTQHVGPLAAGSCTPPVLESNLLTTSKVGVGNGNAYLYTRAGNVSTPADEADVAIQVNLFDVRNASDQSDYSGQVLLSSTLRITDRASGFGGVSATVSDFRFDVPVTCTPSMPAPGGSDCQILTTADTLVPGMVAEGKRSVVSTYNFQVLDAGPDGDVTPAAGCPPTCGTGDEQRYLEQGTFTP